MRKILLIAFTAFLVVSCNSNKTIIKAKVEGMGEGKLTLRILQLNSQRVVDTIKTDNEGSFIYKTRKLSSQPEFYYLYYKERKIASLLIAAGETVYLTTDTLGISSSVEGSPESVLLSNLEKDLESRNREFEALLLKRAEAINSGDAVLADSLNYSLGALFVKNKQSAIKHLYLNPNSLTNVYLLYQKMPGELPLFGDMRDVLLFRRVYDSLSVTYPGSVYLNPLLDEITLREKSDAISSKLLDASEVGFPDIKLPDLKSQMRSLSDLSGKAILLVFWSTTDVNQKLFNRELLDIYDRYSSLGFEIYQVCVDTDKTAWSGAVANQELPWINVCDGLGSASPAVTTYNIREVPSVFLIDKSGTIVARDIFDSKLEKAIAAIF